MKDVYTLPDLNDRTLLDQDAAKPAKLAIIGYPVAQSKSPQMQQAALDMAGIDARYVRIEAKPEDFAEAVHRLISLGFTGANVTVPHKTAAAKLCTTMDPLAHATGAVNTLVFQEGSSNITGFNTDGPGFAKAIREEFSVDIKDLNIVILGATGGAGAALSHTCALRQCERLTLVGRDMDKLCALQKTIAPHLVDERRLEGSADRLRTCLFATEDMEEAINDAHLIVNATTIGMNPADGYPLNPELIMPFHLVYDIITHETALQSAAEEHGARVSNGLSMLVHQGAIAFEHWFGLHPNVTRMKAALGI